MAKKELERTTEVLPLPLPLMRAVNGGARQHQQAWGLSPFTDSWAGVAWGALPRKPRLSLWAAAGAIPP